MNASDEPRMIAMRIHLRSGGAQGAVEERRRPGHMAGRRETWQWLTGPVTGRSVTFHGCARGLTMCTEFLQLRIGLPFATNSFPNTFTTRPPKSSFTNVDALATVLGAFATIAGLF